MVRIWMHGIMTMPKSICQGIMLEWICHSSWDAEGVASASGSEDCLPELEDFPSENRNRAIPLPR